MRERATCDYDVGSVHSDARSSHYMLYLQSLPPDNFESDYPELSGNLSNRFPMSNSIQNPRTFRTLDNRSYMLIISIDYTDIRISIDSVYILLSSVLKLVKLGTQLQSIALL